MKTIAVRLDGLLVENPAALPSVDPIPAAVEFVRALSGGGYTKVFIVTSVLLSLPSVIIRNWLRTYQIPISDLIRLDPDDDWREEDQLLSAAGARSTVLGLLVTANRIEAEYMAEHGVPSIVFVHADPVIEYRPERGLTWSNLGISPEEPEEVTP